MTDNDAHVGEGVPVDKWPPGTVVQHATGGRVTLSHRKADESGWWNTDKSGLSDVALQQGLHDGTWRVVDGSDQGEVPEIFYVTGHTVAEGLRALSERFAIEDNLVLIGLWNVEPPEREGYPEAYLQVVVTHLATEHSGSNAPGPVA